MGWKGLKLAGMGWNILEYAVLGLIMGWNRLELAEIYLNSLE